MDKEEVKEEKDNGPKTIDAGKEAAIEAEVQAARQRAVVPLEIRMKQFRDMLSEKDVCIAVNGIKTNGLIANILSFFIVSK